MISVSPLPSRAGPAKKSVRPARPAGTMALPPWRINWWRAPSRGGHVMSIVQTPGAPARLAPPPRHALGLPAGSVRAILAFAVLAMLWVLALRPLIGGQSVADFKLPLEFVYLQILMVLILAHFFAAHGGSIGPHAGGRS